LAGGKQLAIKVEAFDALNRSYTVADGTQISKGILLKLTDPRTAALADGTAAHTGADTAPAGIANAEKKASDGSTQLGAWVRGIFDIVASGAITVGKPVVFVADGYVAQAPQLSVTASLGIVGRALETASDGERIEVALDIP
jgi:hypothetical protein